MNIKVGARGSLLSRAQVREVLKELQHYHPAVQFTPIFTDTKGDRDQKTSLRGLGKCDFFTREVDCMLLGNECRIAIHSAKDLPEPLPKGLSLVALTKGVDPADSLVFLEPLKSDARIATSSIRREEMVKELLPKATFIDIRGTVEKRLETMQRGEVDGVVIAEAALIRLELTHLSRIKLPGDTAEYQGRLAVVACEGDFEMAAIFKPLDGR